MVVVLAQAWFNQPWVGTVATLLGGLLATSVVVWELRQLSRRNQFDILEAVADRMHRRFGSDPAAQGSSGRSPLRSLLSLQGTKSAPPPSPTAASRFYGLRERFRGQEGPLDSLDSLTSRVRIVWGMSPTVRDQDLEVVTEWVNRLNDVAELIESDLVDLSSFLGKYHLAIIRETFIAEPYVAYTNILGRSGHWGIRVLALGESARQFNAINPVHRRPVHFRGDESYGCILPIRSVSWLRRMTWFARNRLNWYPPLNTRAAQRQRLRLRELERRLQ